MRAARMGDQVSHGLGLLGMVSGAVAGAAIGAAMVTATAATGGVALIAIVGGCVAGGGLAGGSLVRGIMTAMDLPDPTTGAFSIGSPNVLINGRPALRAGVDIAPCSGLMGINHYSLPSALLAEGAETVLVNGFPLGRVSMKLICGGAVKTGSADVLVGGPSIAVATIIDAESIFETALQALGLVALGAGGVLAAAAGGALALAEFGAIAALFQKGFEELHEWGDSLGPGWGDILTGLAGFGLLAAGLRAAKRPTAPVADEMVAGEVAGENASARPVQELLNRKLGGAKVEEFLSAKRADPKLDALLTDEEYLAVRGYTSNLYRDINPALRQGTPGEWEPLSDAGSSGLQKLSENGYAHDGIAIRRGNFTDEQIQELFPEGGVYTDKAFVSSAESAQGAFPGNAEIRIASKSGAKVSSLSEFPHENEVLFKPDSSFEVVSKTYDSSSGKWTIELAEQ